MSATEELDVVIVGAGISGIAMAHQVGRDHPGLSYAVIESRARIGGTWDLFRYPGIRSDSGMDTFAYSFNPWPGTRHFGSGKEIRSYLEETAAEHGIDRHIRFGRRVSAADWDSGSARWTITIEPAGGVEGNGSVPSASSRIRCRFLIGCTGYYRYEQGHSPHFEGEENFQGEIFHAQHWPEGLEVKDRKVVLIGSGATSITVLPVLAGQGAEVTMLQRSPTYVFAVPNEKPLFGLVKGLLPKRTAAWLLRWAGVAVEVAQYQLARRFPDAARRFFIRAARRQLPDDYPKRHLNPAYAPWDQRLCFAPDGDYFAAIASGAARIETGNIERIGSDRIYLREGGELEADVIAKATGLDVLFLGDIDLTIDGEPVDPAERLVYKGAMLSGIPNFVFVVGYTNASWTLKAELVARFTGQFIETVERRATEAGRSPESGVGMPVAPAGMTATAPVFNLDSGYIHRAESRLPKAGDRSPWKLHMNYLTDRREFLGADLEDGTIEFS